MTEQRIIDIQEKGNKVLIVATDGTYNFTCSNEKDKDKFIEAIKERYNSQKSSTKNITNTR